MAIRRARSKDANHGGRAILVGAAPLPPGWLKRELKRLKLSPLDFLIGVDGGVEACLRAGARPSFAVGDWDSLKSRRKLAGIPHATLSRDKDRSDLFFAIEAARFAGAAEVLALGVTGGRPDQFLGALYDLAKASAARRTSFSKVCAVGPDGAFHWVSPAQDRWQVLLRKGSTLSAFAPLGRVSGMKLSGLVYPRVPGGQLFASSQGLSNRAVGGPVSISCTRGVLLVVIPDSRLEKNPVVHP